MAAIVQKNISLIITLVTFVFSVGILFARLETNISTVNKLESEFNRLDKETTAIHRDLQYIKEGITEIKEKLK
jgi:peptidoglycan hydrolase CwlO-like protein